MPAVLSKSSRANPLYNIDKIQARSLQGLCLSVEVECFENFPRHKRKEQFGGIATGYNNNTKLWNIQFNPDTDDIIPLRYNTTIKCIDEYAFNFNQYHLPISLVPSNTTATVGTTEYTKTDMIDWA